VDAAGRFWGEINTPVPDLERPLLLATAVAALVLVAAPAVWRRTRHVVTIAHEGAHGLVAVVAGRRLSGIRLHSDTSGLTVSSGRRTGPGMVVTAAAGYVGPALVGLAAAWLLTRGHAVGVLWALLVLLALLLLQIRNFFGLWSVLVAGAGLFAVTWWAGPDVQLIAAYVVTWFLLVAAPRPVVELHRQRRRGRGRSSDADLLARLTRVPGLAWVGFFLAVTLGCLLAGGRLLVLAAA
jgi:Peptidase M50B-like